MIFFFFFFLFFGFFSSQNITWPLQVGGLNIRHVTIFMSMSCIYKNIHSVIFGCVRSMSTVLAPDLAALYDVDVLNALSCFKDLSYIIAPWPHSDTLGSW